MTKIESIILSALRSVEDGKNPGQAAADLFDYLKGQRIRFSRGAAVRLRVRWMLTSGASITQAVEWSGLAVKTVEKIAREMEG